jgi:N-acetylmuramoyl-L-alanine amidase
MGTETFVMGISKNASNLAVAKKENSVILLESDYKIKYGGYDPNVPETLIGLQLMQEEKREQSINLASKIQEVFTDKLKRVNRGVKEAPLWVLNATYMPSVLIEIGFISNKTDADFIASENGQNQLASVIAEAIVRYKKEFFGSGFSLDNNISIPAKEQSIADSVENLQNQNTIGKTSAASMGKVYKIQLSASTNKISTQSSNFNGLSPVTFLQENKLFKYMYGEFQTLDEAQNAQKEAKAKGYPEAFIVSFENGVKVK